MKRLLIALCLCASTLPAFGQSFSYNPRPTYFGTTWTQAEATFGNELRPPDYGTIYPDQGQICSWTQGSKTGASGVGSAIGRDDRVFTWGYNVDTAGNQENVLNETGWLNRYETGYWWFGDGNVGSSTFTPTLTNSSGNTQIAATGMFATGAQLANTYAPCLVYFSGSQKLYAIISYLNANTAVINRTASNGGGNSLTESGTCQLVIKSIERHEGPLWGDRSGHLRMITCLCNPYIKYAQYGVQADKYTITANSGSSAGNDVFTARYDGIYWDYLPTYYRNNSYISSTSYAWLQETSGSLKIGDASEAAVVRSSALTITPATTITGLITATAGVAGGTISGTTGTFTGNIDNTTSGAYGLTSTSLAVSAAGTGRTTATVLTSAWNRVNAVSSGVTDGVSLPVAGTGATVVIKDDTASILKVYGSSGAMQIDALGSGNPYSIPANSSVSFHKTGTGQWYSFGKAAD